MKVHMICNSHIDPVWLWRWDESASETISTFRSAADFCQEYDGLVFNHNEAILYEWIKEYEPNLFQRIKRLVKEGKWHIIGGWFLQPDCNMPNGEALTRQALVGMNFFQKEFGVTPTIANNFDSFGHNRGLVQLLSKCGYTAYLVCRPGKNNYSFPDADFLWEGYDGSQIVVHRSDENYNSVKGNIAQELKEWFKANDGKEETLHLWGVGNHGGGPSRKDLDDIAALSKDCEHEIIHSIPENYFKNINKDNIPVVKRSLVPIFPGCYTSQIRIKQQYRRLEADLIMVEKMATHCALTEISTYDKESIKEAQRDMLFAQFHDSLPGTAIKSVEDDILRMLGHGLEITARLKTKYFFALTQGEYKLKEDTVPIFVYNPHPFAVEEDIDCEFVLPKQNWGDTFFNPIAYQDNVKLDTQCEKEESNFRMDWRKRAVFRGRLKPCAITRFDIAFEELQNKPPISLVPENGNFVFDNGDMQVVVNVSTGLMESYKVNGLEMIKPGAFCPVVVADSMSAWGLGYDGYHHPVGFFTPVSPQEAAAFSGINIPFCEPVHVAEDGSVRTVIEAVMKWNNSYICQRYILPKNGTGFQVELLVYWLEKGKQLKLSIPTNIGHTPGTKFRSRPEDEQYIGQTVFGREALFKDGRESVSQRWSCYLNSEYAFGVINDGVYGSDCRDGVIRPSLLRGADYSGADDRKPEKKFIPVMDQGERRFAFYITAGKKADVTPIIERKADSFNEKPYALAYCPPANGEKQPVLLEIYEENVRLSCFKEAENGDGYILRLYESAGEVKTAKVVVLGKKFDISLKPFEIKTLRYRKDGSLTINSILEGNA